MPLGFLVFFVSATPSAGLESAQRTSGATVDTPPRWYMEVEKRREGTLVVKNAEESPVSNKAEQNPKTDISNFLQLDNDERNKTTVKPQLTDLTI